MGGCGKTRLAIAGETIYPVSGLDWPTTVRDGRENGQVDFSSQELMAYDAFHLFVERASAFTPHFAVTPDNAVAIAEICRHLDGLPLALELASARTNVLTVQEIAARLNDRFSFLTTGQRTGSEPRHYTLRATIDWSYELLALDEQRLLNRLAVFSAGFTLDTAEVIGAGAGITQGQILELLSSLVTKSLVLAETTGRSHARYRLLETIREYALEKLNEAGETGRMRDRHLELYLVRAEEAMPKQFEAYQRLWLNWLESENDNLRAALAWALESKQIETGLRLASALTYYWEIHSYVREGLRWLESLLAEAGDYQTAFNLTEENILFYRQAGPSFYLGMALLSQGENAIQLGYYEIARERLNESLALARQDGDAFRTAHSLNTLGDLSRLEQQYAEAANAYEIRLWI